MRRQTFLAFSAPRRLRRDQRTLSRSRASRAYQIDFLGAQPGQSSLSASGPANSPRAACPTGGAEGTRLLAGVEHHDRMALHGGSREAPGARRGARGAEPRRHGYGSRGVKEDALACVAMALAMQKRIGELAGAWRDAGIETAAALPHRHPHQLLHGPQFRQRGPDGLHHRRRRREPRLKAPARGPARWRGDLVRDLCPCEGKMHCEPRGEILVKGLAYPVATYSVLGQMQDLEISRQTMRAEMPYLRLEAEPGRMSAEQREQAAVRLRELADQLSCPSL